MTSLDRHLLLSVLPRLRPPPSPKPIPFPFNNLPKVMVIFPVKVHPDHRRVEPQPGSIPSRHPRPQRRCLLISLPHYVITSSRCIALCFQTLPNSFFDNSFLLKFIKTAPGGPSARSRRTSPLSDRYLIILLPRYLHLPHTGARATLLESIGYFTVPTTPRVYPTSETQRSFSALPIVISLLP